MSDIVADVENNEPLPLWRYTSIDQTSSFPMIYSVQFKVKVSRRSFMSNFLVKVVISCNNKHIPSHYV